MLKPKRTLSKTIKYSRRKIIKKKLKKNLVKRDQKEHSEKL